MTPSDGGEPNAQRNGVISIAVAYFAWGFFPLFFRLFDGIAPGLVVAHRTIWSLVFVAIILFYRKRLDEVWVIFRSWKDFLVILASTAVLATNWLVFVWAVENGRVLDSSLGYFITPLVTVMLGMVFLGERQNRWQTLSILIAVAGVAVQGVMLGSLPWPALYLAFSFGTYSYLRKIVSLGSAPGLMAETLLGTPVAIGYVIYMIVTQGPGPHADLATIGLFMAAGPLTAGVLILFAYGARRMRMTTNGMFQYITPSLHFLIAIYVFKEPLQGPVLISFVIIWISLVIFTVDSLRTRKS